MDSDSGVAAEEIKNAAGGSGAGDDAEQEVDEQEGEDGSPDVAGGDEEGKEVEEEGGDGAAEAARGGKRKRGRGRIAREKGREGEGEEEGTASRKRKRRSGAREGATPVERPSRERKRVERFAAMSPRKTSVPKTPSFEQGSGQKLRDIPNVLFKLSKRKADENLRALHSLLFGRKSTVHYLKRNILQFSGYVWSQNEEKQRARVKEKLDKYNKERLLDFCDLLDIHAVKTTTKKEEIVSNLMEFLESPSITRDVILTEKKGKRGRRSKGTSGETPSEKSNKKLRTSDKQSTVDENGDNEEENVSSDVKDEMHDGEDDGNSQEESDHGKSEEEEEQDEPAPTSKSSAKQTKKIIAPSEEKSKVTPVKQLPSSKRLSEDLDVSSDDDPSPPLENKKDSDKEMNEPETKVSAKEKSSRRNKSAKGTKSTSTSSAKKSDSLDDSDSGPPPDSKSKKVGRKGRTKEKPPSKEATGKTKNSKSESKETANKKRGKSKLREAKKNEPSTEELHSVVSKILKEVDFNTATLADILRQLGAHFNTNLMDRKAEVKRIIEDVINNMTDEEDEEEDAEDNAENDDDAKEDSDKEDQK